MHSVTHDQDMMNRTLLVGWTELKYFYYHKKKEKPNQSKINFHPARLCRKLKLQVVSSLLYRYEKKNMSLPTRLSLPRLNSAEFVGNLYITKINH